MERYRVERMKVLVTLKLRGGMEYQGKVFLPPNPSAEPAVHKLRSVLNGFDPFMPVEPQEGAPILHNKERVIWCRYEGPQGPTLEVLMPRRRVTLILEDGSVLSGDLVADGPPEQRRVLDCLNRPEPFLLLEARDCDYLVRRDAIVSVPSAETGEPRADDEAFDMERPGEIGLAM